MSKPQIRYDPQKVIGAKVNTFRSPSELKQMYTRQSSMKVQSTQAMSKDLKIIEPDFQTKYLDQEKVQSKRTVDLQPIVGKQKTNISIKSQNSSPEIDPRKSTSASPKPPAARSQQSLITPVALKPKKPRVEPIENIIKAKNIA